MRSILLLSVLSLFSSVLLAQRPDSVLYNGQWRYIYPIAEELTPTHHFLKKMDLEEQEFEVFREWKIKNDPRANLKWKKLRAALKDELISQKNLVCGRLQGAEQGSLLALDSRFAILYEKASRAVCPRAD